MISWPQQRARERRELRIVLVSFALTVVCFALVLKWTLPYLREGDVAQPAAASAADGGNVMISWKRADVMPRMRTIATDLAANDVRATFGNPVDISLAGLAVQPVGGTAYTVDVAFRLNALISHGSRPVRVRRQYLVVQKDGQWKLYGRGAWSVRPA